MRRWKTYGANSWAFHELVIDSKYRTNTNKRVAIKHQAKLWQRFAEYDYLFSQNDLASLSNERFSLNSKTDHIIKQHLHNLYDYHSFPFESLKEELTTTPTGAEITTCPICRVDLFSSLDHIVPRQAMPEFSTHPYNLIPSCEPCNKRKSTRWEENGHYKYLNPYLDEVEDKEYLRVRIDWIENRGVPVFEVFRGVGISDDLYEKIEAHHKDLELCERYQKRCSELLGSIASDIRRESDGKNLYKIRISLIRKGKEILKTEGSSDWEGLLYLECGRNGRFAKYLLTYQIA